MRTVLLGLALGFTCLAELQVLVPPSAAHPQSWLSPQIRGNPKPAFQGSSAGSFGEFVAPEVLSKIVVDQYAGPADDVQRYLNSLPTAPAQYFGPSLELCMARFNSNGPKTNGARLVWTSTSTVTFESGRSGRLAVATVVVSRVADRSPSSAPGQVPASECFGLDKVPVDSLYANYVDPDGFRWYFIIPLQKKK